MVCLTYIYRSKLYSYQPNHRYEHIKALGGRWVGGLDDNIKSFAWGWSVGIFDGLNNRGNGSRDDLESLMVE